MKRTLDAARDEAGPGSRIQLENMLKVIMRDAEQYFGMGRFTAKKKLPNGYTVTVIIAEPTRSFRSTEEIERTYLPKRTAKERSTRQQVKRK